MSIKLLICSLLLISPIQLIWAYANWNDTGYPLLITPFNPKFDAYRQGFSLTYSEFNQNVTSIMRPRNLAQTVSAVLLANLLKMKICARSGGHDYGGYSSDCTSPAMILDLGSINHVEVDATTHTAVVGAGNTMINLYTRLSQHGFTHTGGLCGPVGTASFLGGGVGLSSRQFGLSSDTVLSMKVVLPSGLVLTVSPTQHQELYWGLLGAGGNHLAIVYEYKIKALSTKAPVTDFLYVFPRPTAAIVWEAWQNWTITADWRLSSFYQANGNTPILFVAGMFNGSQAEYQALEHAHFLGVLANLGIEPLADFSMEMEIPFYQGYMLFFSACPNPLEPLPISAKGLYYCHDHWTSQRYFELINGLPYTGMPKETVDVTLALLDQANNLGYYQGYMWGGAISNPSVNNSVGHRQAAVFMEVAILATSREEYAGYEPIFRQIEAYLTPFLVDHQGKRTAYRNSVQPFIGDGIAACQAYTGEHCPALRRLKCKYDPKFILNFPQSFPCLE